MTDSVDPREGARKGILPWPVGTPEFARITAYVNGYPRPMLDMNMMDLHRAQSQGASLDVIAELREVVARDRATEEYLTGMHDNASVKVTSTEGGTLTSADMIMRDLASHDKPTLEAILGYELSEAQFQDFRAYVGVELEDPNPVIRVTFVGRIETSGISDFAKWKQELENDEEKLVSELFSPFGSCYEIEVADLYVGDEI